ncbi:MAG: hypothetical protein JO022_05775 [Acidobacteriaceae bacterium]|nr:hypothetical protein [Acidobacteriaceae bacterium]
MRNAASIAALLAIALAASPNEKAAKTVGRAGIKTPGIQIPLSRLASEVEIPAANPDWLFFSESLWIPKPDALLRIDPKTNQPFDPIASLSEPCGGMVSAFGSLWAPLCGNGSLARIDAKTFKITATLQTGVSSMHHVIAASDDSIWLLTDDKTTLARIDPDQNTVVGETRLAAGCRAPLFAEKSLWIACPAKNKVLRLNPATNLIDKQIEVAGNPEALTSGEGSVWVLCSKEGKVARIDPKTNQVSKTIDLEIPGASGEIAFHEGSVWVSVPGFPLTRIDPKQDTVAQQFYGAGGGVLAVSPGALWLAHVTAGKVLRIDPKRVLATLAE